MCACCCVVSWLLVLFLVHLGKNLFSQDKLCKNGLYYEQGSGLDKCGEDGFRRFFSTLSSPDGILSCVATATDGGRWLTPCVWMPPQVGLRPVLRLSGGNRV